MAAELVRDDDDFIRRVLSFLPHTMKHGYGDSDSEPSEHGDELLLTREERQDELRGRLHAKLQLLREKSGSLRAQKSLRRRLNKIEKRKQNQKQSGKGGAINSKVNAVKTAKKQKMIERRSNKSAVPSQNWTAKPVFNTDGRVVFSKFDFARGGEQPQSAGRKVSLKAQLAQAKEKQAEKKARGGPEAWDAAMRKAAGEKIKDDPKLLAKSLRRQTQKKKRSKKKWEERQENERQRKAESQNKRDANLNKRKEQKKKKITDKLKKKGRILPGF